MAERGVGVGLIGLGTIGTGVAPTLSTSAPKRFRFGGAMRSVTRLFAGRSTRVGTGAVPPSGMMVTRAWPAIAPGLAIST